MAGLAGADLLRAFVNTRGITRGQPYAREELGSGEAFERWWREHVDPDATWRASSDDLARAHAVREGLRGLVAIHHDAAVDGDAAAVARLEEVLADTPLRATTADGVVGPDRRGSADSALGVLAAALVVVRARGDWERLKVCRDPDCREAFVDATKNRSRTWCSMQVCGARAKQRTFSERHRPQSGVSYDEPANSPPT